MAYFIDVSINLITALVPEPAEELAGKAIGRIANISAPIIVKIRVGNRVHIIVELAILPPILSLRMEAIPDANVKKTIGNKTKPPNCISSDDID